MWSSHVSLHVLHERVVSGTDALLNHCGIHVFGQLEKYQVFRHCHLPLGTNCSWVLVCELSRTPVSMRSLSLRHHWLERVLDGTLPLLCVSSSDGTRVILGHDELFHNL